MLGLWCVCLLGQRELFESGQVGIVSAPWRQSEHSKIQSATIVSARRAVRKTSGPGSKRP